MAEEVGYQHDVAGGAVHLAPGDRFGSPGPTCDGTSTSTATTPSNCRSWRAAVRSGTRTAPRRTPTDPAGREGDPVPMRRATSPGAGRQGIAPDPVPMFLTGRLRRGHATTAARNGASERTIMRTTGHTSTQTVRGYIDDGELFSDPASKYLGL